MLAASMIAIGDELLEGHVADENTPWLAGRLRAHGVPLSHAQIVGDDAHEIGAALHAELARHHPRVVLTSGGVGSTPDDITFEAVAAALGRDVVEDPVLAARMHRLAQRTRDHGVDVDAEALDHLMRMARIPEGARLLTSESSWVPAVAIDVEGGAQATGATVLILPGVPEAFRRVVTEHVEPQLLAGRNDVPAVEEVIHSFPESALNVLFAQVNERFDVRLGSYPGRPMVVRLSGQQEQVGAAARFVRDAIDELAATPGGARLAASWASRPRGGPDDEDAT